jgi:hypothetical protein
LHYSTIIQIQVADAGEAGEELEAWGGTLTGRNGRNLTVTADKKNHGEIGGDTTTIYLIASRMAAVAQRRKQNQRHDNEGSGGTTIKREAAAAR